MLTAMLSGIFKKIKTWVRDISVQVAVVGGYPLAVGKEEKLSLKISTSDKSIIYI